MHTQYANGCQTTGNSGTDHNTQARKSDSDHAEPPSMHTQYWNDYFRNRS
jgi:hypothetical protein